MCETKFRRTKFACYAAYFTMSSVFCLPPLLFVTFHESYGISWTLLGTLILTNFCTQLLVDFVFTAFAKKFNIANIVRTMPLITSFGLLIYALSPIIFTGNYVYIGLLLGTVIFSVSAGLSEVLLSPTIAAIPSKNPQRDMSLLHSLYAFGVFFVVVCGTLFLKIFGSDTWMYLTMCFAALPIIAAVLFMISPMPDMNLGESGAKAEANKGKTLKIMLCVLCIFLGSCAENVMSNWVSSYMEAELGFDKTLGDILGMAGFAILLGATRVCYAKWGKNIWKMLLIGMVGAFVCYFVAGISQHAIPAFIACVFTGFFTAMLWPGSLILMEEKVDGVGVAAYALMAAGGDLGASFAPQLMGIVSDYAGMQTGMLISAIFPLLGIVVLLTMSRIFKKKI